VSEGLGWLLAMCGWKLQARYADPGGRWLEIGGTAVAALLAARLAWCAVTTLAGMARAGRNHRLRLLLAGRPDTRLGALVVEHGEAAAYCMPGARQPVVLTTAALRLLDDAQLAAVMAHERAHQAGRHHLLVSLAAVPAAAFPWLPAFARVRDEVARLAELAAVVRSAHPGAMMISAGMTGDLEEAIAEGATHVRVGTALLGSRRAFVR
jgi:Zn-dependent protease with chaperone function